MPDKIRGRIGDRIALLSVEPRPHGVQKLQGGDNSYRVRVGDYRIHYEIEDDILLVTVFRVVFSLLTKSLPAFFAYLATMLQVPTAIEPMEVFPDESSPSLATEADAASF